jgi:hypothetical protein
MLIHSTDTPLYLENHILSLTSVDCLPSMGYRFHFGEVLGFCPGFRGQKMTSVELGSEAEAE